MKKKKETKKKMLEQKLEWATDQVYCKRKGFCIAIQSMYFKLERLEEVRHCIARLRCIASWLLVRLYCNTVY